ncbi:hypothetical protein [Streptomyces sp. NPDC088766]|uniref:hypothetical protein n=1 Tax=Streptomyces sp. NPDC088766 TaxID=3365893 RepID=UPI00380C8422
MSDDRIAPGEPVAPDPETGRETPYFSFGLPAEAEPTTMVTPTPTPTSDHNHVVVRSGRPFSGVKKAESPAAGRPKRTCPVLGRRSAAAGR